MTVDPSIADWLKAPALYASAADAVVAARWGDAAQESSIMSGIADRAAAEREAARQLAFLSGPLAIDTHNIPGFQRGLLGKVVTITADRLGYQSGVDVFVIGYQEQNVNMATVKVLRRL